MPGRLAVQQQAAHSFGQMMQRIQLRRGCQPRHVWQWEVGARRKPDRHDDQKERQAHVVNARNDRGEIESDGGETQRGEEQQRNRHRQPRPVQRQFSRKPKSDQHYADDHRVGRRERGRPEGFAPDDVFESHHRGQLAFPRFLEVHADVRAEEGLKE